MNRDWLLGRLVCCGLALAGCDAPSEPEASQTPDAQVTMVDAELSPDEGRSDRVAPNWPDDAKLTVVRLQADRVILNWSVATDETGIGQYELRRDDIAIATKAAHQLGGAVIGLAPATEYAFQIIAIDTAGNRSDGGPSVTIITPDEASPYWPDASAMRASDLTETSLSLSWSRAQDDVGVTQYRLYQDNLEFEILGPNETRLDVTGLTPGATFTFRVEAEDAEGNLSIDGPTLVIQPSDLSPPTWPADAQFLAGDLAPRALTLGWSMAVDNIAISQYVIRQDAVVIAQTEGAVTWLDIEDLWPWTEYTFTVEAMDGAGNQSEGLLSLTISTPDHAAPTWNVGTAILVTDPQIDQVTLSWPAALDDVGIGGYRIYGDLVLLTETSTDVRRWTVRDLNQDETYGFSVQAVDAAGNESRDGPHLQVQLSDDQAPQWAADATLTMDARTDSTISLSWPAASDNIAVTTYAMSMDGELVRSVDDATTSMTLANLVPNTEYTFTLMAGDAAGNVATPGLVAVLNTMPDQTAPTWPPNATLSTDDVGQTHTVLRWTSAEDAVGVTAYTVLEGAVERARTEARTARIEGLEPNTDYTFTVQAMDAEGNGTAEGPSVTFTTQRPAPIGPSTAEVYAGLRPSCGPCHYPGAPADTAYFVSEMTFQGLVAGNRALVTPGDPDNSLLIQLLEGDGPGDFSQMPLQGDSFSVMSAAGNTEITIQAIRQWVLELANGVEP